MSANWQQVEPSLKGECQCSRKSSKTSWSCLFVRCDLLRWATNSGKVFASVVCLFVKLAVEAVLNSFGTWNWYKTG